MPLKIEENVILANFSTFRIGGPAKYFVRVKNQREIEKAIKWAKNKNLPFFILGLGSNILFSDKGLNGLVIKLQNTKYEIRDTKIIAQAGCQLPKLVQESVQKGLAGLEWAVGIPGTIGGAIYQNAGAFGREMKDVVEKVKIAELINGEVRIKKLNNRDCEFGYRDSIFRRKKNLIILEATLKLKKGEKEKLKKRVKEILKMRDKKQPLGYPSAGSIFKNLPLEKVPKEIQKKFREKIKNNFLPTGALIEKAGLKGKKIGGAKISEKHANFIINFKNATARDVLRLIELVRKKVKERFKVELEKEIEYVSEDGKK